MKALLIANLRHDAQKYKERLEADGYEVTHVSSIEAGREYVRRHRLLFDIVSVGGCESSFAEALAGILTRDAPRCATRGRRRRVA